MKSSLFVFVFILFSAIVLPAHAYTVTKTNAFSVDGRTAVFTIDYTFQHGTYNLVMPLKAERGSTASGTVLTYTIVNGSGQPGKGVAHGIVLSSSPLKNNTYVLPKGVRGDYRLLVLYTRTEDEATEPLMLQVTGLPFAFENVQPLSLNPSELASYKTDPIMLLNNGSNRIIRH